MTKKATKKRDEIRTCGENGPRYMEKRGGRRSEFEKNEDNEKKDKIRTCGENGPGYMEKKGGRRSEFEKKGHLTPCTVSCGARWRAPARVRPV